MVGLICQLTRNSCETGEHLQSMVQSFSLIHWFGSLMLLWAIACQHTGAQNNTNQEIVLAGEPPVSQTLKPTNNLPVNKARLLLSARLGGNYLLRIQKSDGSFRYLYDASKDEFDESTYNILRHAGTAYSLFQLYETTREVRYLNAARKAMLFLKSRFRPAHIKNAVYVLDFDGKAKLGANGLALLALTRQLQLDNKSANLADAKRLANMILAQQHQDGSFQSYHPVRGDEPEGSVSLYYPGEAILGLIGLYRIEADKRLLDAAERGANYLIQSERRMPALPPDAWLMQALEALHKIKPEQQYIDHAIAIAETMISYQYDEEDSPEYAGGFSPGVPRSTPAASRSEGILAAYRMAKAAKDSRAVKLANALKLSARFQLSQQLTDDDKSIVPNPQRATGGFRESLEGMRIRIDYVQHNISALLGIAEALY
jgi:hypothetical protein